MTQARRRLRRTWARPPALPTIARGYGAAPAPTSAEAAAAGLARTARKRANLPRHSTPDCDPVARRCLHRRATRRAAAVLVPIGVRPAGGGRGDARARPSVPHPSPGRPGRRRRRRLGRGAVPLVWVRRAARAVRRPFPARGRFRSRTCTRSPRGARTRPSWSWPIATTSASAPRPTTTPREPVRCSSSPEATGFARDRRRHARAHDRVPVHRRRRLRRPGRRSLPRALVVPEPSHRGRQPDGDRRPARASDRHRGRPPPLARSHLRADGREPRRTADGSRASAGHRPRTADRPRVSVQLLRAGPVRRPRRSGDHADDRGRTPASAATDTLDALVVRRIGQAGGAAEGILGSLDEGVALPGSTATYIWLGPRIIRGWAIKLVLIAPLPFLLAAVDLRALSAKADPTRSSLRSYRSRLAFWLWTGVVFGAPRCSESGATEPPDRRRPTRASPATYPCWPSESSVLSPRRLVRRSRAAPAPAPGQRRGGARRPDGGAPRLGRGRAADGGDEPVRPHLPAPVAPCLALAAAGAVPAALDSGSGALGRPRRPPPPARLLRLALRARRRCALVRRPAGRARVRPVPSVAIGLAWLAAAGQLAAVSAGRYAPYPSARASASWAGARADPAAAPGLPRSQQGAGALRAVGS